VEFRILGSLEVVAGGRTLDLGGAVQRRVLAALLLSPNRVVPIERLIEVGWDGTPPATAERQVRNRVAALRSILTRHGGFIDTEDSGYRLRVDQGASDALVFEDLVAQGRPGEALALWRGRPFEGLGTALARDASMWEDRWLAAVEEHAELSVDELSALVASYPLRERLVGRLMVALDRSGRRPDALAVYAELAGRLADRLGIDPSPELRRLRDSIEDPAAAAPAPTGPTPQQLPGDVAAFTGRLAELERLDRAFSDGQAQRAVVISAIAGTAGVGKTALAVHWGHRVRSRFPDGQLYVNLRGYAQAAPVRPIDALGGFLRALGVAGERVPTDVDQAAALYQTMLADRQVLVLLDNATDAEQVRPLVPTTGSSFAVVTSRSALDGLDSIRFALEVLDGSEAIDLLTRILGAGRVAVEPAAVAELAALCAYLPLALRIAAANLIDGTGIADYVERLRTGNRLAELAVEGDPSAAVRGAFDLSYAGLDEPAQRMFRLLGLILGPDISVEAAASLAGVPVVEATALLARLVDAHLVERVGGRYGCHDLLRLYAGELVGGGPEAADAEDRLLDHYLHTAYGASQVTEEIAGAPGLDDLRPGVFVRTMATPGEAIEWANAERATLVAAVRRTAAVGRDADVWRLALVLDRTAGGLDRDGVARPRCGQPIGQHRLAGPFARRARERIRSGGSLR
jgi:DNA-binding SARP family transcriptional activator